MGGPEAWHRNWLSPAYAWTGEMDEDAPRIASLAGPPGGTAWTGVPCRVRRGPAQSGAALGAQYDTARLPVRVAGAGAGQCRGGPAPDWNAQNARHAHHTQRWLHLHAYRPR